MRAVMQVARAARRVESLSANTQRTGVSAMSMPLRRALTPSTATGVRSVHSTAVVRAGISNKHVDTPDNNADTPFEFSETSQKEIAFILSKYPGNYKMSAVIPILWLAQKQTDGWLPLAAMNKTAEICQMSPILVYEVATFYTMFNRKKIGKYNIQMCTTTPCMVLGAYDVLDTVQKHLDCKIGGDTKDMQFHLMEAECLGACANAPMMQISHAGGDEYFEDLTRENVIPVLDAYQKDELPPPGPQHTNCGFYGNFDGIYDNPAGHQNAGLPEDKGVRAGPQPGGPQGYTGHTRRGCEGPQGKTTLLDPPYGPSCRPLVAKAAE